MGSCFIVRALSRSHEELDAALTANSASSEKVAKVIKMIDEITFQTNILALNAAVETARAGEVGMGFAVVADEVRNLAHRSADAARDTSVLIEEALAKSRDGRQKVNAVNQKMDASNKIAGAVKAATDEIGAASTEQTRGIEQISTAISQMNQVVQCTAAQAEENAAASEQLNAQSQMLQEIVARLSRLISGHDRSGIDWPRLASESNRRSRRDALAPAHNTAASANAIAGMRYIA
jgi:methyl-accepting chemotaxis protein